MDENENENKMDELFKWKPVRNIFFVKNWTKETRWNFFYVGLFWIIQDLKCLNHISYFPDILYIKLCSV
jgi:hypothetical protein